MTALLAAERVAAVFAGRPVPGLPTPQTLIEAVMYAVRERRLGALKEPATRERLARCDQAAKAQINGRIAKLIEAGRIPEASNAAA